MNALYKIIFHVTLMPSAQTLLVASHVLVLLAILEMAAIAMVNHHYTLCVKYHIFSIQDVDECVLDMDECDKNAVCINSVGSYNCTCGFGYTGDGFTCTG